MNKEKKMYAWMPSNCERFDEIYDSIEDAVAEAQRQWDEKYEYYEEENENNTEIYLMVARQFNPENLLDRYGEVLINYMEDQLYDFTHGADSDPGVCCNNIVLFNQKVKEALVPLVKEYVSFRDDMVGDILTLTYNVETCKYYWNGVEYDAIPDAFRFKG
jgi:hypothetical protein